jgi:uncharacterized protein YhhL (DUF1145 family)
MSLQFTVILGAMAPLAPLNPPMNAVQFFQRVLAKMLATMAQSSVLIYVADILVLQGRLQK